jgi:hypothetical protein
MKNDTIICQSCSMPMTNESKFGTEKDGSLSKEYCVYCYQKGSFTKPKVTLEEMIDLLAPNWAKWTERPDLTLDDAIIEIRGTLSQLKRWKNKEEKSKSGCCCCHRK